MPRGMSPPRQFPDSGTQGGEGTARLAANCGHATSASLALSNWQLMIISCILPFVWFMAGIDVAVCETRHLGRRNVKALRIASEKKPPNNSYQQSNCSQ